MTEAEWLTAIEPFAMLEHFKKSMSDRKLLLFTAMCVRRHLILPFNQDSHCLGLAGEQFLTGTITTQTFQDAVTQHYGTDYPSTLSRNRFFNAHIVSQFVVETFRFHAAHGRYFGEDIHIAGHQEIGRREWMRHCAFLRELIGNPFRIAVDTAWLTSTVTGIAETIYQDRTFGNLPILADALQDAGCDNEDILNHCRQPGEHVRGCWVVDLVTGRK